MIVGACGFGSTGSSVISDYLLEFGDTAVLDGLEFDLVAGVDGIIDLEHHIMNSHFRSYDSVVAISRYRKRNLRESRLYRISGGIPKDVFMDATDRFLDSITDVSWDWYNLEPNSIKELYFEHYLLQKKVIPFLERKLKRRISCYPMKTAQLSVNRDNFYTAAKEHVREILTLMGADFSKRIVLDQPFAAGNPQVCFPYFDDPYAIVVDRDPRDNYIFARTKLLSRNHFMPADNVVDFVKYYKAIRVNQPYKQENERVLFVQFEDLVYNYDDATSKIRDFLHLPENPNPKSIFNPELSLANTQVFRRFPDYADDIKYIEENLTDYLFDFSKYPAPDLSKEMFFGKSPLHR